MAEGVRDRMPDDFDLEQVLNAALARHEAGQLDLAEAGYRTVLRHDPNEPDALNLLAVILQERGDLDGSIALLTRALAIVPDFPEALANLARAHRVAGAPWRRRTPRGAPSRWIRICRRRISNWGALCSTWAIMPVRPRPCARQPPWRRSRWMPGAARHGPDPAERPSGRRRPPDRRLGAGSTALAPTLNLAPALADLARAYRAAGDAEAAIEAARRAVALDPALPDAQVQLGLALLMQQDEAGAVEVLRRGTEMAPGSVEARSVLRPR